MTLYQGIRLTDGSVRVVKHESPSRSLALRPRLDLANHSPTGFEWGYGGSGPAQLALAILADVLHDDALALRYHQRFKWKFITPLPRDEEWRISSAEVREFIQSRIST